MMNRFHWRNILFKRLRSFRAACRRYLIVLTERLLFRLEEQAVILRPDRAVIFSKAEREDAGGKPCDWNGKNKDADKTDTGRTDANRTDAGRMGPERTWVLSGYTDHMICCDLRVGKGDVPEEISRRIDAFVQEKKLFLNPDLTLDGLARELGSNRTYLSRALSRCKGEHFNRYVNSFRLRHAARMLEDGRGLDALDMALLSGFKNERTFRRALKECSAEEVLYLKKRYICKNR